MHLLICLLKELNSRNSGATYEYYRNEHQFIPQNLWSSLSSIIRENAPYLEAVAISYQWTTGFIDRGVCFEHPNALSLRAYVSVEVYRKHSEEVRESHISEKLWYVRWYEQTSSHFGIRLDAHSEVPMDYLVANRRTIGADTRQGKFLLCTASVRLERFVVAFAITSKIFHNKIVCSPANATLLVLPRYV